jgi:hypothetical protein
MLEVNKSWLDNGGQRVWEGIDPKSKEHVHDTPYEHAVRKLRNMKRYIGGFPEIMDCVNVNYLYGDYEIDASLPYDQLTSYLDQQKEALSSRILKTKDDKLKKYYEELIKPNRRATTVNALYAGPFNAIGKFL